MSKSRHVEIGGAGFAGLVAGAALAQRGWSVRIHERDTECRSFGAGIWFWENGVRVLDAIGAADQALEGALVIPRWESREVGGEAIDGFEFGNHEEGGRLFCIVRQQLYDAVLAAALRSGVDIVTNSKVIGATPEGELLLEDGAALKGDLVIGADGIHSKVREQLELLTDRQQHGDGAIRVNVHRTEEEANDPKWSEIIEWWSGHRRLLYTPCSRDTLYLCLTSIVEDEQALKIPVPKGEWKKSFPDAARFIDRIPETGRWDPFESIYVSSWSRGRTAILGDAAHGMVPGLGQGCGTAVVNALSLAAHSGRARHCRGRSGRLGGPGETLDGSRGILVLDHLAPNAHPGWDRPASLQLFRLSGVAHGATQPSVFAHPLRNRKTSALAPAESQGTDELLTGNGDSHWIATGFSAALTTENLFVFPIL